MKLQCERYLVKKKRSVCRGFKKGVTDNVPFPRPLTFMTTLPTSLTYKNKTKSSDLHVAYEARNDVHHVKQMKQTNGGFSHFDRCLGEGSLPV